jgi:hypothetical protein
MEGSTLMRFRPLGRMETGLDIRLPKGKLVKRMGSSHVTSFPVRESGFSQAAPGGAAPFYPKKGMTGRKWVAVSGDGSQVQLKLFVQ